MIVEFLHIFVWFDHLHPMLDISPLLGSTSVCTELCIHTLLGDVLAASSLWPFTRGCSKDPSAGFCGGHTLVIHLGKEQQAWFWITYRSLTFVRAECSPRPVAPTCICRRKDEGPAAWCPEQHFRLFPDLTRLIGTNRYLTALICIFVATHADRASGLVPSAYLLGAVFVKVSPSSFFN